MPRPLRINGTSGNDTLIVPQPGSPITIVHGLDGDDMLIGGAGGDSLYGDAGNDVLNGGDGDDGLEGGEGADQLNGGAGIDTVSYWGSASGVKVSLATGSASGGDAKGDTFSGIENLSGSQFNDTLAGDGGDNRLEGQHGDDTLLGGGGNDTLRGDDGADYLDGGAGVDTIEYARSTAGVSVDLKAGTASGGDAQGDQIKNIENVYGSFHDDVINGDGGANVLNGGAGGDDLLFGGGGNDTLVGGGGNDTLEGGAGADVMSGSFDADTASYATSDAGVEVNLQTGFAAGGHAQGDTLSMIENVTGSAFADRLTGTSGDNVIQGGGGNDTIRAGGGIDQVWGGAGDDLFVFNQADPSLGWGTNYEYIGDFVAGGSEDVIDLRNAGTGFTSLNDVLAHAIQGQFNGQPGTMIDLGPSGSVYLDGVRMTDLTASDFIFV